MTLRATIELRCNNGISNEYPINKLIAVFVTVKMTFFIVVYFKDHIFNEYPHREMKLYIPFCGCENDNFHSRCF